MRDREKEILSGAVEEIFMTIKPEDLKEGCVKQRDLTLKVLEKFIEVREKAIKDNLLKIFDTLVSNK